HQTVHLGGRSESSGILRTDDSRFFPVLPPANKRFLPSPPFLLRSQAELPSPASSALPEESTALHFLALLRMVCFSDIPAALPFPRTLSPDVFSSQID